MACHLVARANILARLDSTFLALVPTSATLTENNGFCVAVAIVSAVDVLPTPGGPRSCVRTCVRRRGHRVRDESQMGFQVRLAIKKNYEALAFARYDVVHLQSVFLVRIPVGHRRRCVAVYKVKKKVLGGIPC